MAVNKKLAIFCGSSTPKDPEFFNEIKQFLGKLFNERPFDIVYGGANIGVMGQVADIALSYSRLVYGVMPTFLKDREVDHQGITQFEICETMHDRKEKMYLLSDAFLILPGGLGTFDEFYEILTWRQLKLHQKPIYLFNLRGYFDSTLEQLRQMEAMGFIKSEDLKLIKVVQTVADID